MNGKKFRQALKRLEMTHEDFGDLFQLSQRTVTNYASGGVTNTPTMILINLLLQDRVTSGDIERARRG